MMEHYYDKLLQIAVFQPDVVHNKYLVLEASKGNIYIQFSFQFRKNIFNFQFKVTSRTSLKLVLIDWLIGMITMGKKNFNKKNN